MRELVIKNLTLVVDARNFNAISEAREVIELANDYLDDADGGPTLYLELDNAPIVAEYRDNGEDDE